MDALLDAFAALPGRIVDTAVYAWQHPAILAVAAVAGAAGAISFYIHVRSGNGKGN